MRSTVMAGSSRSVSRVPGPPPRTSIEATAGSSNTIAVTPEARRASWACPIRTPATSVMRLCSAMGYYHSQSHRCHVFAGDLRSVHPSSHLGGMASDVSVLAALFAGLISFLSPCVLPLVPPYLAFLAGSSLERFADAEPKTLVKRDTILAALLFVAGFSTIFVALGAGASAIGGLLRFYSHELAIIAGIAIIVMGLHFLGITPIRFLYRQARLEVPKPVGRWGGYVMGLAFALGWTPCIGPILATILAVAASEATVTKGAGLLAIYSLGLGVPFIIR